MNGKKSIFERLGMIERVDQVPGDSEEPVSSESENEIEKPLFSGDTKNDNAKNETTKNDNVRIDRVMNIQEIYRNLNLAPGGINTVFIIDSFSKALPENLPTAVKRQSVLNLISTSGMNVEDIIKDGKSRLAGLDNFLQSYVDKTDEVIAKNEAEIKLLEQKINEHKKYISEKKKLKQEQKALVEYESQRIQNIVQFIQEV